MGETELPSGDVLSEEKIIEKSAVYVDPMAPDVSYTSSSPSYSGD
jgi:hypothetical protein